MTLKIKPTTGPVVDATPTQIAQIRTDLGLGQVDNTPDASKPVSTAQQAAINTAVAAANAHAANSANPHATTKDQVGLGNVDNTADADKPISTLQQAALDTKQTIYPDVDLPDADTTLTALAHGGRNLIFPATATASHVYTVQNNAAGGGTGVQYKIITRHATFVPTITNGSQSVVGSLTKIVGAEKTSETTSVMLAVSASGAAATPVDNLTTNDPAQPLSAAQGVVLKAAVDGKAASYAPASIAGAGNLTVSGNGNRTAYYDGASAGVLTASTDSVTGATADEGWSIIKRGTGVPSISNGSISVTGGANVMLGAIRVSANNYQLWSMSPWSGVAFGASGSGAHDGLVPSPGTSAGTTRFLREDGTWAVPAGSNAQPSIATLTVENAAPNQAVLTFSAALSSTYVPAPGDFQWTNSAGSQSVSSVAVSGSTVTLGLSRATLGGETMTCAYPRPTTNALQTTGGELAQAFGVKAVTNGVSALPTVVSATISSATPNTITVDFTQALTSAAPSGAGGFALTVSGAAMTVTSVAITGGDAVLTCSRNFAAGETVTLAYTQPGSNNLASASGAVANFSGQSVTNNVASSFVRMMTRNNAPESGDAVTGWIYSPTGTPAYSTHNVGDADKSFPPSNSSDVYVEFKITRPSNAGNAFYGLDLTAEPGTFTTFSWAVYAPSSGNYQFYNGSITAFGTVSGEVASAPQDGDKIRVTRLGGTGVLRCHLYRSAAPSTAIYLGDINGFNVNVTTAQLYPKVTWSATAGQAVGPITHSGMT